MATDYGTDVSCAPDLTSDARVVSGRRLVAECVYNRFRTPRGSAKDAPNDGYDLEELLDADIGPGDLGRITAAIQAEATKDQRVIKAAAQVSMVGTDLVVVLTLTDAVGPFPLVLSVSKVGVILLQAP